QIRDILARLGKKVEKFESAVVITNAGARYFLRQIAEATLPNLTVSSHSEIPPSVKVRSRGVIEWHPPTLSGSNRISRRRWMRRSHRLAKNWARKRCC